MRDRLRPIDTDRSLRGDVTPRFGGYAAFAALMGKVAARFDVRSMDTVPDRPEKRRSR